MFRRRLLRAATVVAIAVLASVAAPRDAAAQRATGVTLTLTGVPASATVNSTRSEVKLNIEACRDAADALDENVRFAWAFATPGTNRRYAIKINPGSTGCARTVGGSDEENCNVVAAEQTLTSSVTRDIELGEILTGVTSGDDCLNSTTPSRYEVHVFFENTADTTDTPADDLTVFLLNLTRPSAPSVAPTLRAGEVSVGVSWDSVDDDFTYRVFYSTDRAALEGLAIPEDVPSGVRSRVSTSTSTTLTDLDTGATYFVAVASINDDGNLSLLGPVASVTTAPTSDFFEQYKDAGGVEAGGCTAAGGQRVPAAGMWLAMLAGALLGRRGAGRRVRSARGRAPWAGGALAALALVSTPATAAADILYARDSSGITGMFELKLGLYAPDLDAEFDGATPYEDAFGGKAPLSLSAAYDRYVWDRFGRIGVYGEAGWRQVSGFAATLDGEKSEDETRLLTLPLRVGASYRFDELAERFNVPLAFAVKLGLDYTLWFVRNDGGVSDWESEDGERSVGRGGTTGFHVGLGAFLLLDFLAPKMAHSFDESAGVNNSYAFVEVTSARLNDFGGASSWDLSDTFLQFGLAFEF